MCAYIVVRTGRSLYGYISTLDVVLPQAQSALCIESLSLGPEAYGFNYAGWRTSRRDPHPSPPPSTGFTVHITSPGHLLGY